MYRLKLKADVRRAVGTRPSRRLRSQGEVPAILYGHHYKPVSLSINERDLNQLVGKNALIDLEIGDEITTVVFKDIQRSAIKRELVHADLQAVEMGERIHIFVPIHLTGHPRGTKTGGILQYRLREVEIECLPADMPTELSLDISDIEIGDFVTVNHLVLNNEGNFAILTPANEIIASLSVPVVGEVEKTSEENITTMPDVIHAKHDTEAEDAANKEAAIVY